MTKPSAKSEYNQLTYGDTPIEFIQFRYAKTRNENNTNNYLANQCKKDSNFEYCVVDGKLTLLFSSFLDGVQTLNLFGLI